MYTARTRLEIYGTYIAKRIYMGIFYFVFLPQLHLHTLLHLSIEAIQRRKNQLLNLMLYFHGDIYNVLEKRWNKVFLSTTFAEYSHF